LERRPRSRRLAAPLRSLRGACHDRHQPGVRRMRKPIVLRPGEGRPYPMGGISAVFKADGAETAERDSISDGWREPHTTGPGPHSHDEDDVFFVIEGMMSFLVDGNWLDAPKGSFVLVPANCTHDFENRSDARAGLLNLSVPGNFEQHMPDIVRWFAEHP